MRNGRKQQAEDEQPIYLRARRCLEGGNRESSFNTILEGLGVLVREGGKQVLENQWEATQDAAATPGN